MALPAEVQLAANGNDFIEGLQRYYTALLTKSVEEGGAGLTPAQARTIAEQVGNYYSRSANRGQHESVAAGTIISDAGAAGLSADQTRDVRAILEPNHNDTRDTINLYVGENANVTRPAAAPGVHPTPPVFDIPPPAAPSGPAPGAGTPTPGMSWGSILAVLGIRHAAGVPAAAAAPAGGQPAPAPAAQAVPTLEQARQFHQQFGAAMANGNTSDAITALQGIDRYNEHLLANTQDPQQQAQLRETIRINRATITELSRPNHLTDILNERPRGSSKTVHEMIMNGTPQENTLATQYAGNRLGGVSAESLNGILAQQQQSPIPQHRTQVGQLQQQFGAMMVSGNIPAARAALEALNQHNEERHAPRALIERNNRAMEALNNPDTLRQTMALTPRGMHHTLGEMISSNNPSVRRFATAYACNLLGGEAEGSNEMRDLRTAMAASLNGLAGRPNPNIGGQPVDLDYNTPLGNPIGASWTRGRPTQTQQAYNNLMGNLGAHGMLPGGAGGRGR